MDSTKQAILVVDDEEAIRGILCRKLGVDGYECDVAADGKEALWKAFMKDFDLVLMDIKMPGLSGMEALPQMVTDHPDTSVVMLTALADANTATEAMKQGAYDFVTKPFDLDDLSMRVSRALERRKLLLENREYQRRLEERVQWQAGQVHQYYQEATEALSREQVALNRLDGGDHQGLLEEAFTQMARSLALIAEAHEPYAVGHSERVSLRAGEIASQLRLSPEMTEQIKMAATLHDIGKVVIRDDILFKPGPLTPAEYSEVKRHPGAAVEILHRIEYFKDIIPLVESHHEWYNGKGYPKKLKGDEIPLGARIIAVADAFDAMTCSRPYRPTFMSHEDAIQALKKGAAAQWEPRIVDALIRVLERESKMLQSTPSEVA